MKQAWIAVLLLALPAGATPQHDKPQQFSIFTQDVGKPRLNIESVHLGAENKPEKDKAPKPIPPGHLRHRHHWRGRGVGHHEVPEPMPLALVSSGLLGLAWMARRR